MNSTLSGTIRRSVIFASALLASAGSFARPAPSTTATTLSVSSSSVSVGATLTLTATVTTNSGNSPVTPGLVTFCDASAAYCVGPAILGTAQLNASGTATLKVLLGIGNHSIKAIFNQTATRSGSASATQSIAVTGLTPTAILLSSSGSTGGYSLLSNLGYLGLSPVTAGESVIFTDSTNGNLQLGTATLGSVAAPSYAFNTVIGSPFGNDTLPAAIAAGDFNGDGITDLAVADYSANTVTVYAGNMNGVFTALGSPIQVGVNPVAIGIGDFNNDGFADLAVVNATDGTISVLLGDGSGDFSLASSSSTLGNGPSSLAILDANADGNADIVVTNQLSSTYSVLLGDGTGHFSPSTASPVQAGGNPSSVVAADFNQDGLTDIAIANTFDGTVSVLSNQVDGTFVDTTGSPFSVPVPPSPAVASTPSALAVGDFDADGRPDLAILDANNNRVSFLLDKASGAQFAASSAATGMSPASVVVGDFNGDGKQDLAIANTNDSTVTMLQGDGTGQFTTSGQSPLANFNGALAMSLVSDINSNGLQDLAVTNVGANCVSIRKLSVAQLAAATLTPVTVYGGGTHTVKASYAGDDNYAASMSATVSLAGTLIPTTSSFAISPNNTVSYGATVQLTNSVNPGSDDNYSATGTITFKDGSAAIDTANVANGQGAISINSLAIGPHSLIASYSGDTNFASSTSSTTTLTVVQAGTTTALTVSASSIIVGSNIQLTANVSPATSGAPTGSVSFYDGSTSLCSGTLTNSVATCSTSALAPGSHSIIAVYAGSTNYASSTSAASAVTVDTTTSSIVLSSSLNPALVTAAVSFSATVTSKVATPTGSVGFYDGTTLIGTVSLANGQAVYTTSSLTIGAHSITAAYSGDANNASSTSSAVSELIQDFSVSTPGSGSGGTGASSVTVTPGQPATYQFSIGPSSGTTFPDPVTLSISGLPEGATATFNPQTLPAGSSLSAVTLTINLPSQVASRDSEANRLAPIALGLLFLPFMGMMRLGARKLGGLVVLLLVLAGSLSIAGLTGCGSSSGFFGQQQKTYILTITATSGSVSHSTNVTLIVE